MLNSQRTLLGGRNCSECCGDSGSEESPPLKYKHEAYFTTHDFHALYVAFMQENWHYGGKRKSKIIHSDDLLPLSQIVLSRKPEHQLLCAKACFLEGDYLMCMKIVEKLPYQYSNKVLYERTALIIKASYLRESQQIDTIESAVTSFMEYRTAKKLINDRPMTEFHTNNIEELQRICEIHEAVCKRAKDADMNALSKLINELERQPKYQGMPSYLISKKWYLKFRYATQGSHPPGPISNFQLLNHIFEHEVQQNSSKIIQTLLFPCNQTLQYIVLGSQSYIKLEQIFDGIQVKRLYRKDPEYDALSGQDNLIKLVFETPLSQQTTVLQFQKGTYLETSLIGHFYNFFGVGQLKENVGQHQHYLVKPGPISSARNIYKYAQFEHFRIKALTESEKHTKQQYIYLYDMENYLSLDISRSGGRMGIKSHPQYSKTTYINTFVNVFSQLESFIVYFLQNKYLSQINLSGGSLGQSACVIADSLKQMWYSDPQYCPSLLLDGLKQFVLTHITSRMSQERDSWKRKEGRRLTVLQKRGLIDEHIKQQQTKMKQEQDPSVFIVKLLGMLQADLIDSQEEKSRINIPNSKLTTTSNSFPQQQIAILQDNCHKYHRLVHNTVVNQLFDGFCSNETHCKRCSFKQYSYSAFRTYNLTVPVKQPKQMLFFVPAETLGEQAVRIQFYLQGLTTMLDLIDLIRKQLELGNIFSLRPFFLTSEMVLEEKQIGGNETMIDIFKNVEVMGKKLFLYEMPDVKHYEKLALMTYHYSGFQWKASSVDGFPRFIALSPDLLDSKNKQQLLEIVLQTIPLATVEASKKPAICSLRINKGSKQYDVKILVQTKDEIVNFKYIPSRQIAGKMGHQTNFSLEQCFRNMMQEIFVSVSESFWCPQCGQHVNAVRSSKIYETRQIMILTLNRFPGHQKILTSISYPIDDFDVGPLTFQRIDRKYKRAWTSCFGVKHDADLSESIRNRQQNNPHFSYDLIGVINHQGSEIATGHFFAYVRSLKNGFWYLYDDQIVQEIEQDVVVSPNAYILIYQRSDRQRRQHWRSMNRSRKKSTHIQSKQKQPPVFEIQKQRDRSEDLMEY